jgi:hypothetical protein
VSQRCHCNFHSCAILSMWECYFIKCNRSMFNVNLIRCHFVYEISHDIMLASCNPCETFFLVQNSKCIIV